MRHLTRIQFYRSAAGAALALVACAMAVFVAARYFV
jgi:hypothetical protein